MSSIPEILKEELDQLKSDIIFRHEASGQKSSGETEKGFETILPNNYTGELLGFSYSGVLEKGRMQGRVPRDFVDILKRWAQAKEISFSNEADFNRWANAVAWKIRKEGTKLYRSGLTQDIFTTPIEQFQNRLSLRIANYFEQEVNNQIFTK